MLTKLNPTSSIYSPSTKVTGIPRTNVPGLYKAIFPYLLPIMLICIVYRNILLNHVLASTHRAVVTAWSPEMVIAPFLQMRKLLPEHSATSTFDHLRYITYGIFWRVFDKQMHMIRVYYHVNDLNIKLHTRLPDNYLG